MAQLLIPSPLRKFTQQQGRIEVQCSTIHDSLRELTDKFPELKEHIFETDGNVRPFLRLFVGDTDSEDLQGADTPVHEKDEISIIPAIAGGTN